MLEKYHGEWRGNVAQVYEEMSSKRQSRRADCLTPLIGDKRRSVSDAQRHPFSAQFDRAVDTERTYSNSARKFVGDRAELAWMRA